jgi:hypothetical protein
MNNSNIETIMEVYNVDEKRALEIIETVSALPYSPRLLFFHILNNN